MISDVDGMPGVQIKISTREAFAGRLVYRGEVLIDGSPAMYIDRDAAGRRIRRELPLRTAEYTAAGLAELRDVLTDDVRDCELAR